MRIINVGFLATLGRTLTGACAGLVTTLLAFAVLDYLILGDRAITRSTSPPAYAPLIVLALMGFGGGAGAVVGAFYGARQICGIKKHIVLGVLWGIGIVAVIGLPSATTYAPHSSDSHQLAWLRYGIPAGAIAGGVVGGLYSYFRSARSRR